ADDGGEGRPQALHAEGDLGAASRAGGHAARPVLLSEGDVFFEGWTLGPEEVRQLSRITLLACGTSFHSGLAGRAMIESLARIPVEVELASEFRYRDPLLEPRQLAVAISPSGETPGTL